MSKYNICVYAISKNEEKYVEKWVQSMSEADHIVVADTGSTDNTIPLLESLGVEVHSIHVDPWRFDEARNLSIDLIADDVDICVCTDLDEVFDPGWRAQLEDTWTKETTRLRYNYTFGFHPDGTPIVTFLYEKIHRRKDFKWIYPVHEVLEYSGKEPDKYAIQQGIHLKHYPDPNKSRGNYLKLLELSAKDFPLYDRNIHYLGREYMFHHQFDQAIETLEYHLSLPTATWKEERSTSMRFIARCHLANNNIDTAIIWLKKAIMESPNVRESYIEYARIAYRLKDWATLLSLVNAALTYSCRTGTYLDEEASWGYTLFDYGAIACYYLGQYKEAYSYAREAVTLAPTDKRLQDNLLLIKTAYEQSRKDED